MEKFKRYVILFIGLFTCSFGVVLVTKGNLGTSAVSSIPYVLSLIFPMTMGAFTIYFSLFLILLQLLILGKNFKLEHALQIPVSILFGYFIDICMPILEFVKPESYPAKILVLLAGCVVIGVAVYLEVLADVVMLPGESIVRAVVTRMNTEFGVTKICIDVTMSVSAGIISLICLKELQGVREGTIIASLLVGFIARQLKKRLAFLPEKIFGK